jgi:hypothetical protein
VHQGLLAAVTIEDLAAGACHQGTRLLRRQPLAGLPHGIFPSGPVPLIAPRLKIGFSLDQDARQFMVDYMNTLLAKRST